MEDLFLFSLDAKYLEFILLEVSFWSPIKTAGFIEVEGTSTH